VRSEQMLGEATAEAERAAALVLEDAEARLESANEEIVALHEQADARMRALEDDIARIADSRRVLLADAKALAARLAQVVADAEAAERSTDVQEAPVDEPAGSAATDDVAPVKPSARDTDAGRQRAVEERAG
jgi:hypothetical protein